jgi:hypothetical protein
VVSESSPLLTVPLLLNKEVNLKLNKESQKNPPTPKIKDQIKGKTKNNKHQKNISSKDKVILNTQVNKKLETKEVNIGDDESSAARNLMGWSKVPGKVPVNDYVRLVTQLNGSVFNRRKGIHFAAPSLTTGQWHAVTMHYIHIGDRQLIPPDTRHWKIAKQLLIDIDLTEDKLAN